MYSDYNENKTYPIRRLLVGIVLVILFVLLLVWILPTSKIDLRGLNGINNKLDILTNRIFTSNVDLMKNAAVNYYTKDRLPNNIGDKTRLSLKEMLDKKLVLEILDKKGDSCDVNKSYVEVVKKTKDEYEMKVNLKCNDKEDYIIVHLGCYNYCEDFLCEKAIGLIKNKDGKTVLVRDPYKKPSTPPKTVISGPSCELMVTDGVYGKNEWFTSDVKVGFKYKGTSTNGAKIISYGLSETSLPTYGLDNNYVVGKNGTTVVYGYVKDSNNKTAVCTIKVKKDNIKPTCRVEITSAVKNAEGLFVGDVRSDLVSKVDKESGVNRFGMDTSSKIVFNSKKSITTSKAGKHNIYGFVEDNAGNREICHLSYTVVDGGNTPISKPSCELEVKEGTKGLNDWYRSNVVVGFKNKKTSLGAKIVGWGITTANPIYDQSNTFNINEDGYYTVKGYVKDSNGYKSVCSLNIKKDTTKPTCSLGVISGNYNNNGYYIGNVTVGFKSRFDSLSGVNTYGLNVLPTVDYNQKESHVITNDGTHIIYGSIRDNAGNVNACSIKVVKKSLSFEYQYSKYIETVYSNWSSWLTKEYNKNNPPSWKNTDVYEVEDLGGITTTKYHEKIGEPIMQQDTEYYKSVNIKACEGYDYYIMGNKTENVYTQTAKKNIYTAKTGESSAWKYEGIFTYTQPPTNTLAYRFEFVGLDWSKCGASCTTTPYTRWKKYSRSLGTTTTVASNPGETTHRTVTSVTYKGVEVKCNNLVVKPVKIYAAFQKQVGFTIVREPIVTTVYKYRYRVRNIIKNAYTDYKWSPSINDTNLISQGYKYTGNKRIVG